MEWRMLQRWWYTSMLTPIHAFMISSKQGNTWYHSSGPYIPTCIILVSLCKPWQSEVKTKSNCHFPHEQSETGLKPHNSMGVFKIELHPKCEWVKKYICFKSICCKELSSKILLHGVVNLSFIMIYCDIFHMWQHWSMWFVAHISMADRLLFILSADFSSWSTVYFFAMIHNQLRNFWILTESSQLKRCWWYSFVNLEDSFDADENFWWILDSIEIAIFWFSAFFIWFGKCC